MFLEYMRKFVRDGMSLGPWSAFTGTLGKMMLNVM